MASHQMIGKRDAHCKLGAIDPQYKDPRKRDVALAET